jgi:ABC-type transport system substrate-binding protein
MTNAAGQKLAFTVINIGDYSDWVASMQVIQQDLKAVGIQITPDNLSNTDFDADLYYGKYQLAYYDQQTFGPSAYYELNNWLNSATRRRSARWRPATTSATATRPPTSCSTSTPPPRARPPSSRS